MTVIVFDGRTLAADTLMVSGSLKDYTSKIQRTADGWLIGAEGDACVAQMLRAWFESSRKPEDYPYKTAPWEQQAYLVAVSPDGQQILSFERGPVPVRVCSRTYATGSGAAFARGALAQGADARRAVAVAMQLCVSCGGEVEALDLVQSRAAPQPVRTPKLDIVV